MRDGERVSSAAQLIVCPRHQDIVDRVVAAVAIFGIESASDEAGLLVSLNVVIDQLSDAEAHGGTQQPVGPRDRVMRIPPLHSGSLKRLRWRDVFPG